MFEESPKGVDPKVNSRSYSGTESSSTGALSLAWISTQNDCIKIKKKEKNHELLYFGQITLLLTTPFKCSVIIMSQDKNNNKGQETKFIS
jgi:hypothetical protein